MSSILFDKLPLAVKVAGVEFNINTDYRCMARFENELLKVDRNNRDKRTKIFIDTLVDFYCGNVPSDILAAIEAMWWFYRCGEDVTSRKNQAGNSRTYARLYDYEVDGSRIAADFRGIYSIELTSENLHWWLFKSYFADLPSDCGTVKVMCYRGMDLREIKNRRERARYQKLKEYHALPEIKRIPMTKEERDRAFKERLLGRR